ncbi:MAG: phage recombination protein Bet [Sulfobacillus sp.]
MSTAAQAALSNITQSDFSREKIDLIKRTIAVGVTDDELQLFLYACKKTGLDPLARQIYAVKRWNGKLKREIMTVQTGIDGYRLIADRTGRLAGISDAVFDNENDPHPNKATVTVKKMLEGGIITEFTASARWNEYAQTAKDKETGKLYYTGLWDKMPFLMLGKCSEALALRKAFPADLSGVYTAEEMAQADNPLPAEPQLTTVDSYGNEKPVPPKGPVPTGAPAVDPGPFELKGDVLKCVVLGATRKKTPGEKPKDYLYVTWNGLLQGFRFGTSFDTALFDLIMGSVNQTVELKLHPWKEGDKFLNIVDLLTVGGIAVDNPREEAKP